MPPMPRIAPRSLRDAAVEIWIQVKESGFNSVPQMTWSWLDLTSVGGQRWNHHEIIMTMNSWSYWIWIYLNRFHSWLWGILFLLFDPKKWPMLGMFGSQHFWHVLHFDKKSGETRSTPNKPMYAGFQRMCRVWHSCGTCGAIGVNWLGPAELN